MNLYIQYSKNLLDRKWDSYNLNGQWSEDWDFNILSASLTIPHQFFDKTFDVDFDVNVGDSVYVLVLDYSTGDRFGIGTGHGNILWVFKNKTTAEIAKQLWLYGLYDKDEYIEFELESKQRMKLLNPCLGEFDHPDELKIVEIKIT